MLLTETVIFFLALAVLLWFLFDKNSNGGVKTKPLAPSRSDGGGESPDIPLDLKNLEKSGLNHIFLFAYGREGRVDLVRDKKGKKFALKTYLCAQDSQNNELRVLKFLASQPRFYKSSIRFQQVVGPTSILLEFIDGPSLKKFSREYPTRRSYLKGLVAATERAILELHARGISHGDALSKNVIVHPKSTPSSPRIVLCDFTHSRILDELTEDERVRAINFDLEKIDEMKRGSFL